MPKLLVMSNVVLACQRRVDMEGNGTISPAEWKSLISEQYGQIYSIAIQSGMRFRESTQTITADGSASYELYGDHEETVGVERVTDSAGRTVMLDELMIQERGVFSGSTGTACAYSIVGSSVVLMPRPTTGTYVLTYVPQAPDLTQFGDSDTIDVFTGNGEAALTWGVAVKACAKTRNDPGLAIAERDAALQRFSNDAMMRAAQNPRRRVVMRSQLIDGYSDDCGLLIDEASWRWR